MSEWTRRGYVPDSDSETSLSDTEPPHGEEQESGNRQRSVLEDDAPAYQHDNGLPLSSGQLSRSGNRATYEGRQGPVEAFEDIDELQAEYFTPREIISPAIAGCKESALSPIEKQDIPRFLSSLATDEVAQRSSQDIQPSPSSPLSPALSFVASPPATPHAQDESIQQQPATLSNPMVVITPHASQLHPQLNDRRTFRQRNPIQLHPYLLESEKYRQSLRARGLRPVHVTEEELRRQAESQLDTQCHQGSQHDSGSDGDVPLSSSPLVASSPQPQAASTQTSNDGELPSLDDMLKVRLQHSVRKGFKRQKTSHHIALAASTQAARLIQSRVEATNGDEVDQKLIGKLPSPNFANRRHVDGRELPSVQTKKFRYLPGHEPSQLLTPGPSSDNDKHRIETVATDSESYVEPLPRSASRSRPSSGYRSRRSSSPISVSDASQDDGQIRKATKRIKGVLPASWLRIDQQAQRGRLAHPSKARDDVSPRKSVGGRGVAKRVTSVIKFTDEGDARNVGSDLFLDAGGESASHTSTRRKRDEAPSTTPHVGHRLPQETQEVEVDDYVDPMLPRASRAQHGRNKKRRQLGLKDAFARKPGVTPGKTTYEPEYYGSLRSDRPRSGFNSSNKRKTRMYGIVDALASSPSAGGPPDFLRIALRRVEKRKDKGRHLPSAKQISFHMSEDTKMIQQRLDDWHYGRIKGRHRNSQNTIVQPARTPLKESSGNQQTRFPAPVKLTSPTPKTNRERTSPSYDQLGRPPIKTLSRRKQQSRLNMVSAEQRTMLPRPECAQTPRVIRDRAHRKAIPELRDALFARPGQLDSRDQPGENSFTSGAFLDTLNHLDDDYHHRERFHQRIANPMLDRYLDPERDTRHSQDRPDKPTAEVSHARPPNRRRRLRKLPPQIVAMRDRGVAALDFEDHFPAESSRRISHCNDQAPLPGLPSFGSAYTNDFGTRRLPVGVYFHQSTFLGSCQLQEVLKSGTRDIELQQPPTSVYHNGNTYRWGPWNEEVLSQLRSILLPTDVEAVTAVPLTCQPLRSIVAFFAKSLYFSDSLDRCRCVLQLNALLKDKLDSEAPPVSNGEIQSLDDSSMKDALSRATYNAVLAYQIRQTAQHQCVTSEARKTSSDLFIKATKRLTGLILSHGLNQIDCLKDATYADTTGTYCIKDDQCAAEGFVVLHHLLYSVGPQQPQIWDVVGEALLAKTTNLPADFGDLESQWRTIFTILPFLDVDTQGLIERSSHQELSAGWNIVKPLLTRVFDAYNAMSTDQAPNMNSYLRAIMSRCHVLSSSWKWANSETILGTMFDFFARRSFSSLAREGTHGSPKFLERLDQCHSPSLEPSDRSFDIFLKLLTHVLSKIRSTMPNKKTKNIIWRFVPNHGHKHAKETKLREEDLDALRNQHNLLCVLYWLSPNGLRISTSHLRNLVEVKSSHSEVIRINIRSWANLVRYQLSTKEDITSLDPFADWFNSMIRDLISLHRQARVEAETAYTAAQNTGKGQTMSRDLVESVIDGNERQVEGLLTMALASLNALIEGPASINMAQHLFGQCDIAACLALFSPKKTRLFKQVSLALEGCQIYLRSWTPGASAETHDDNDDSQDFGDWSDVEALANVEPDSLGKLGTVISDVQSCLSNCLGAETMFDDSLLTKATDTWVIACQTRVHLKQRSWNYFFDTHSTGSWYQFRDTPQTRMYGIYFGARAIEADHCAYHGDTARILEIWLNSLVERESMLKYQHLLTNALLNLDIDSSLLHNLPFTKKPGTDDYETSLQDIRGRRINILSSVLSNIRSDVEATMLSVDVSAEKMREEYARLLKSLMEEMKRVFQETQQDSTFTGAYVEFVQQVIELLQQYTADIVPVDKFFTDSGAFPLPARDPTYVVGRLKSYRSTLASEGTQKKLALFLQGICGRAVSDNQQDYLVRQLAETVHGSWEDPDPRSVTLRKVLLEAIFPVYISQVFKTDCGWLLALPLIKASGMIVEQLGFAFNTVDKRVVSSIVRIVGSLLSPMRAALFRVASNTSLLSEPSVSSTISAIFQAAAMMLPIVDYTERLTNSHDSMIESLLYIHAFGTMLLRKSKDQDPRIDLCSFREPAAATDATFKDITAFCKQALTETLSKNWTRHGDEYFVQRGRERREVTVDLATPEKELEDMLAVVDRFMIVWKRMPGLRVLA